MAPWSPGNFEVINLSYWYSFWSRWQRRSRVVQNTEYILHLMGMAEWARVLIWASTYATVFPSRQGGVHNHIGSTVASGGVSRCS